MIKTFLLVCIVNKLSCKEIILKIFELASLMGTFLSTVISIIMWHIYKLYHRDEWHKVYQERHEYSIKKVNEYLIWQFNTDYLIYCVCIKVNNKTTGKQDLDSASYFHNSVKVLTNDIEIFTASDGGKKETPKEKPKENGFTYIYLS